jgi:anti-sigma-K factor RskA
VPGEPEPVIVTPYVPAVVELNVHDAATVALAVILTGAGHVTIKPVTGLVTAAKLIVPAKLNVLVRETEIAEPVAPELKLTGEPALIVKLPTWTVDVAE